MEVQRVGSWSASLSRVEPPAAARSGTLVFLIKQELSKSAVQQLSCGL